MGKINIYNFIFWCIVCTIHSTEQNELCSPPSVWVQGTDKNSGKEVKLIFDEDSQSEIILRDLKDVSVHCEAEYSVQLEFEGYADFKFLAAGSGSSSKTVSNGTVQSIIQKHTTYVHLVSLREVYTGLYTCHGRSSQTKSSSVSAYIFVPTNKLFVSTRTATLSSNTTTTDRFLLIPCPIAEPNATVYLVKSIKEDIIAPVSSAEYNPRQGFLLDATTAEQNQTGDTVEGTYFCIAKKNDVIQAVEFDVIDGLVECDKKCNENSKCVLVNEQQVCQCRPSYEQTRLSEKCLKECKVDVDCPKNMRCLSQDLDSFLFTLLSEAARSSKDMDRKDGTCKNPCVFVNNDCFPEQQCQLVDQTPTCV